jgi:hypothetical protein
LIVLQTTAPQDQDAIDEWIKRNGTDEERKMLMSSLASLQRGEAWIYSPAWLSVFEKINIRDRQTFNSSATPKAGEKQINPKLAPVNLEKLSVQIKATIEKVKENDPAILKKEIIRLNNELTAIKKSKSVIEPEELLKLKEENKKLIKQLEVQSKINLSIKTTIEKAINILVSQNQADNFKNISIEAQKSTPKTFLSVSPRKEVNHRETPKPRQEAVNNSEIKLRDGARRMLSALVQWSPNGMYEAQMRSHAGLKNSGTYSAYKSELRKSGLIEERGGMFYATDKGIEHLGGNIEAPTTTEEVLAIWMPKLRLGARRMLEVLIQHGGEAITDAQLQEEAELSNSGTYSAYKTELKTAQLAIVDRGVISANRETLFL